MTGRDAPRLRRRTGRRLLLLAGALALLLASCESVFTTSLLSFLQRDPSKLSPEQQVAYGRDALASGDPDQMAAAYDVLKDSDDPSTQLLAADLALGAVELEGTLLEAASADDPVAAIEAALDGYSDDDFAKMSDAAALVDAADDSVEPTAEQYVFAAAGLLAVAAESTDADPNVAQAHAFLDAAAASLQADGESTDLLDQIAGTTGWTAP